jgi:chromosome segregation ATPase
MTDLPEIAELPVPAPDLNKEAAMRAATYYDLVEQERTEHRRLLEQAKMACEVKDHQIDDLRLQVATLNNRLDSMQNAYNEKAQDCADLEAILSTQQAHHEDQAARLARFEFSRLRRKRNGKHKPSDAVSDTSGSEAALAELSSVVARRTAEPLLGQSGETG